jgi:hypothetical protein
MAFNIHHVRSVKALDFYSLQVRRIRSTRRLPALLIVFDIPSKRNKIDSHAFFVCDEIQLIPAPLDCATTLAFKNGYRADFELVETKLI